MVNSMCKYFYQNGNGVPLQDTEIQSKLLAALLDLQQLPTDQLEVIMKEKVCPIVPGPSNP